MWTPRHTAFALLLAAALPAGAADDVKDVRAKFLQAIAGRDDAAVTETARTLGGLDRRQAVEALLDGYNALARILFDEIAPKLEKARKDAAEARERFKLATDPKRKEAEAEVDAIEKDQTACRKFQNVIANQIGRFKSPEAVDELIDRLKSGGEWGIRAGIAEALGEVDSDKVVKALLAHIDAKKEPAAGVRITALNSIARKAPADAAKDVAKALSDPFWQVQLAALDALKAIKSRDAVPDLIDALKGADGNLKDKINDVLVHLTNGIDKHGDHATWKDWWETQGKGGAAGTGVSAAEGGQLVLRGGGKPGMTSFYGLPIVSKRIVFVLDRSGSMKEPTDWEPEKVTASGPGGAADVPKPKGKRKIDIAKFELEKAIRGLAEDVEFNLIFYSDKMTILQEKVLLPANKGNKERAVQFVRDIEPLGNTNVYDSTKMAIELQGSVPGKKGGGAAPPARPAGGATAAMKAPVYGGPDTLYLLTDGLPTAGTIVDPKKILEKLAEDNKVFKVTIHCIGVGMKNNKDGENFLKKIASDTGGTYVAR